ncbi:MAG: hypothetical protein AAFR55_03900 [Pseudomonadota bacterium]
MERSDTYGEGRIMLGRIVLILIQFGVSWRLAPEISRLLPDFGDMNIFAMAVIFGLMVWLIGVLGHLVLKDVAQPTPSTLAFSVLVAVIFAGATLIPDVTQAISRIVAVPIVLYPLIGAVLGYAVKR